MKTILITGGTSGSGKALALHYLAEGDHVIIVGSSLEKGKQLLIEAKEQGAELRAEFIQADLSLLTENQRVIREVKEKNTKLDLLILAAAYQKERKTIRVTSENVEFVFALMYLSRYILSYGFKDLLLASQHPVIVNIAAPGMRGEVNWEDLQFKQEYNSQKVKFHTSRLNDLLAVQFTTINSENKIKYLLYNPWAVKSEGALTASNFFIKSLFTKMIYAIIGKTPEEAMRPLIAILAEHPQENLSAFKLNQALVLTTDEYNKDKAEKLDYLTKELLKENGLEKR